jgi:hypothetical protein
MNQYLITIKYSNGTYKEFYISATKILEAERKVLYGMKHLLTDAYSLTTETI